MSAAELTIPELQNMLDHLLITAGSDSPWVAYVRARIAELEDRQRRAELPAIDYTTPAGQVSEKWYLRSHDGQGDAHRGHLSNDDTVTALCGATFRPVSRLFGKGPAFLRPPVDPVQACPACRSTYGEISRSDDADGAAVLGLIDTLSSPGSNKHRQKES